MRDGDGAHSEERHLDQRQSWLSQMPSQDRAMYSGTTSPALPSRSQGLLSPLQMPGFNFPMPGPFLPSMASPRMPVAQVVTAALATQNMTYISLSKRFPVDPSAEHLIATNAYEKRLNWFTTRDELWVESPSVGKKLFSTSITPHHPLIGQKGLAWQTDSGFILTTSETMQGSGLIYTLSRDPADQEIKQVIANRSIEDVKSKRSGKAWSAKAFLLTYRDENNDVVVMKLPFLFTKDVQGPSWKILGQRHLMLYMPDGSAIEHQPRNAVLDFDRTVRLVRQSAPKHAEMGSHAVAKATTPASSHKRPAVSTQLSTDETPSATEPSNKRKKPETVASNSPIQQTDVVQQTPLATSPATQVASEKTTTAEIVRDQRLKLLHTELGLILATAIQINHPELNAIKRYLNGIYKMNVLISDGRDDVPLPAEAVPTFCEAIFDAFKSQPKAQQFILSSLAQILKSFMLPIPDAYQAEPLFLSEHQSELGRPMNAFEAGDQALASMAQTVRFAAVPSPNQAQGNPDAKKGTDSTNRLHLML